MLRFVAVCCSLLQFVAVCCSLLQFVAVCCSLLQFVIVVFVRPILSSRICDPPPCRCRSPASGSKASRTTLYCRHADSAAADEKYFCAPVELESSSGCPALHPDGFALQTYVPADCESRRNVWRMRTAGEGGLSHVFASRAAVPHPAARFAQSTFHSRMTDAACNLAPVWTVRTICQHRPYCHTAHCLHCLSCWKVFFRRGWFLCPAIGVIAIFGW